MRFAILNYLIDIMSIIITKTELDVIAFIHDTKLNILSLQSDLILKPMLILVELFFLMRL